MQRSQSIALTVFAALVATAPAVAQTGMKNGSANVNATKAKCSPGDPNVMVDPKTKTYAIDSAAIGGGASKMANGSSKTTTAQSGASGGATTNAAGSSAAGGMSESSGNTSNMMSMCKSQAESMGAKMAPNGTQKKSM